MAKWKELWGAGTTGVPPASTSPYPYTVKPQPSTKIISSGNVWTDALKPDPLGSILKFCFDNNIEFTRVGSSRIVKRPEDYDILVMAPKDTIQEFLLQREKDKEYWYQGGSEWDGSEFTSFKSTGLYKGLPVNIIAAHTQEMYDNFKKADEICFHKKIVSKAERIAVHMFIRGEEGKPTLEQFTKIITKPMTEEEDATAAGVFF